MSFEVAADAYDRFMGRFSRLLAPQMVELASVRPGDDALDVGCGTGMLTAVLVDRLGAGHVTGIDPSASFVDAARQRFPGARIDHGFAESLPYPDASFDVAIAQLVVHFMRDPLEGIREMRRVARPGGTLAACVWDHAGGTGPVSLYWDAAREVTPGTPDESDLAGAREGHLVELFEAAELGDVEGAVVVAPLEFAAFDDYWAPFERGVGPAGAHLAALDAATRARLRERARELAGAEPFTITARAWAARGRA